MTKKEELAALINTLFSACVDTFYNKGKPLADAGKLNGNAVLKLRLKILKEEEVKLNQIANFICPIAFKQDPSWEITCQGIIKDALTKMFLYAKDEQDISFEKLKAVLVVSGNLTEESSYAKLKEFFAGEEQEYYKHIWLAVTSAPKTRASYFELLQNKFKLFENQNEKKPSLHYYFVYFYLRDLILQDYNLFKKMFAAGPQTLAQVFTNMWKNILEKNPSEFINTELLPADRPFEFRLIRTKDSNSFPDVLVMAMPVPSIVPEAAMVAAVMYEDHARMFTMEMSFLEGQEPSFVVGEIGVEKRMNLGRVKNGEEFVSHVLKVVEEAEKNKA